MASLNPRTTAYEFLGPAGAFLISAGVPLTTYALYYGCSEQTGGCPPPGLTLSFFTEKLVTLPFHLLEPSWWLNLWSELWDTEASLMYLAWYTFCVVAWRVLPGAEVPGTTMRDGNVKKYKINAFSTFLLALGLVSGLILRSGPESFTFLYERWIGFVTASVIMSVTQAVAVYAMSFREGALLALGGNSGNIMYDWFIGRQLNPTISILGAEFDIKTFNELRPGLILWALIDISMMCEQAVRRGGFTGVTDSMWLVLFFQIGYVADGLYNEPAILTTMDITTDGFGFMLSVGDLAWVPFVYSLQARYLAFHPTTLGPVYTALIILVDALGFYIFRSANGEKNDFRSGNDTRNLQYLTVTTTSGKQSKLITSIRITLGIYLMALAWSLPTGIETPITYFYVVYFAVLLVHRQMRDDEACEKKYGKDWEKYKKLVRWRIIPYVY
ncbi:ERG4/ERG24 ergosterol biosynthesis protein [Gymnopus androsaceus JB14]|uniref:ERG4/ERG24 ergosterol biosynthesis protein n=1 Tax=Gymnopus androsaceus JB14 TaxID=1447944 RepID=A0A6A4GLT6_9AGAR|nr:ERG4/ERG24 ergosterol biosynthesis protein [Gymnopus androsaceus JB14]